MLIILAWCDDPPKGTAFAGPGGFGPMDGTNEKTPGAERKDINRRFREETGKGGSRTDREAGPRGCEGASAQVEKPALHAAAGFRIEADRQAGAREGRGTSAAA